MFFVQGRFNFFFFEFSTLYVEWRQILPTCRLLDSKNPEISLLETILSKYQFFEAVREWLKMS